ncbi:MAG TPA: guanylate kinase [Desulfurivibrionaceae bacterium]|nr:guanylate kinase [Desulfurivibrionaceae bacterium]
MSAVGQLFIISAPSGAGKTTILRQVMAELPGLAFSVSHTTRAPRAGEVNGQDYHFVDRGTFERLRATGDFLEWAEVHTNLYGTSRSAVAGQLAAGLDVILDIDVQGARQVRTIPELAAISLFILPPSLAELENRLSGRGTDAPEVIRLRLENAILEISESTGYDHRIINAKLDEAVEMVKAVILAARSRTDRGWNGEPLPEFSRPLEGRD